MRYLGIDWGLKRVGLALSEGILSSPLGTFSINSLQKGITLVLDHVKSDKINLIVLGKPEGEMGKIVEKVARLLRQHNVQVALVDETLSSQNAQKMMIEMRMGKKKRQDDNALAATIILQEYLNTLK